MENEPAILALAALAQSTRLETFRLLVRHEPAGLPAGVVARHLAIPANTLSAHLGVLSRAGLITSERHSRSVIYRADLDRLRDLILFMLNDCCDGQAGLCEPFIEALTPRHSSEAVPDLSPEEGLEPFSAEDGGAVVDNTERGVR